MARTRVLLLPLLLLAIAAGCSTAAQDDRNELRMYATRDDVPREERVRVLMAILSNNDEDPHLRATAIQMLGELHVEEAVPYLVEMLGGGEIPEPETSEFIRFEAIIALGQFRRPDLYRKGLELMYENRREPSDVVRRAYIQSFSHVRSILPGELHGDFAGADPVAASRRIARAAASAEVLLEVMRFARNINEDESIVWTALVELRRITGRPDLDAWEFSRWEQHIAEMRGADSAARAFAGSPTGGDTPDGPVDTPH